MNRVVVVGSGAAGLTAALEAARDGSRSVILVTKGPLGESNSLYAQGGVAAAVFDDDSVDLHVADTLAAGAGFGDRGAARILCEEGPERIRDLLALGTPFDRAPDGSLARGLEAAHSVARVLHAGGDATGRAIIATLTAAMRASRVSVWEYSFVRDLVTHAGAITGIRLLRDGREHLLPVDAVIVATGGAGQLYRHTTNPAGATGDGVAVAMRIGARVIDAEFMQFHPTALAVPRTPLVSEAVRGDGAVLLDETGERFMQEAHPDAELAPRDVVARAIARQMEAQSGTPVLLDARRLGASHLQQRFPGFWSLATRHGLDPSCEPVPVTPAAHYWMGGLEVDDRGRTAVPGLFAVGEAACSRAHGANRLASNSLLDALVTGTRAASALGESWPSMPEPEAVVTNTGSTPMSRERLQQLMWVGAGLHRDAEGLAAARHELAQACVPLGASPRVVDLETANLLTLARVVVAAASARTVSVGAHFRADDVTPVTDTPTLAREASIAC